MRMAGPVSINTFHCLGVMYKVVDGVVDVPEKVVPIAMSHGFKLAAPVPVPEEVPNNSLKSDFAETVAKMSREELMAYCAEHEIALGAGRLSTSELRAKVFESGPK
jgi:hypothetical protein